MIGLYSRKRFSPCLSSPAASCREILKIVINWMLSGENWPIRVGRSAFPAPEVFIGVIDLPAKRELIGLSVSRSASRRDFIAEAPVRREFLYTVLSDINPFVSRGQLIENVISRTRFSVVLAGIGSREEDALRTRQSGIAVRALRRDTRLIIGRRRQVNYSVTRLGSSAL